MNKASFVLKREAECFVYFGLSSFFSYKDSGSLILKRAKKILILDDATIESTTPQDLEIIKALPLTRSLSNHHGLGMNRSTMYCSTRI